MFPFLARHGWLDRKCEGRPEGWSLESQGSVHMGVTDIRLTLCGITPELGHRARWLPRPALYHSLAFHPQMVLVAFLGSSSSGKPPPLTPRGPAGPLL